jgi:hypothetical protein
MKRKGLSVLLSAAMLCMLVSSGTWAEETEQPPKDTFAGVAETEVFETEAPKEDGTVTITSRTVPWYLGELDTTFDSPVYFVDGVTDLPYVNLGDWVDVMVSVYSWNGDTNYALALETDGHVAMFSRETGYSMLFDFQEGTITFDDYDAFIHNADNSSLKDMVSLNLTDDDGNPMLLEKIQEGSFDRYGKEVELNLSDYMIPMVWSEENGLYLVPLQTVADFMLAYPLNLNPYFNEEAVYLTNKDYLGFETGELTDIGISLFSAPYGKMSEDLAWYSYCELCLALDNLYGLKEIHDITSFDKVFKETGYKADLCSTDPNVADGALSDFIHYYLDDLHSGFNFASYRTEELKSADGEGGLSAIRDGKNYELFSQARNNAKTPIKPYEEVGNTAYITFDGFHMISNPEFYYEGDIYVDDEESVESVDTVLLVLYAHSMINRENSPIENVVIDLSMNGGGQVDAAAIVAAWFLGEASLSVRSSLTGAISTGTYRVDANLDHKFDENDTVADKNLYCLIGPYSFSCGNLVPNLFKSSNQVTLLGHTSGGGSCSVLPMSTAYGTSFQISSPNRMSYLKNGSYYDTDLGIEPDCYIVKPDNFYDREALTDYINQLF